MTPDRDSSLGDYHEKSCTNDHGKWLSNLTAGLGLCPMRHRSSATILRPFPSSATRLSWERASCRLRTRTLAARVQREALDFSMPSLKVSCPYSDIEQVCSRRAITSIYNNGRQRTLRQPCASTGRLRSIVPGFQPSGIMPFLRAPLSPSTGAVFFDRLRLGLRSDVVAQRSGLHCRILIAPPIAG